MTFEWTSAGFLDAGGKKLEYACFGPPPSEAPTLVLLHEGLGSAALWRDFPKELASASGFGVFAYSRAGYGWSDPAELPRSLDYMTREAVDVLPQVLDASASFAAFSWDTAMGQPLLRSMQAACRITACAVLF